MTAGINGVLSGMSKLNRFKTSDIRISTDSTGMMTATHKFQGTLDDGTYHASRAECRRRAVETLKEMKEQSEAEPVQFTGGGWGFSN